VENEQVTQASAGGGAKNELLQTDDFSLGD